ncbi:hypothetical protein V2J09_016638 [Rumex salicifolius]
MGDRNPAGAATSNTSSLDAPPPVSLVPPSQKSKRNYWKSIRVLRSIFRSFPILTPRACKFPTGVLLDPNRSIRAGTKLTGTLFGRVRVSLQESSRCVPTLVLELAVEMCVLQKDLRLGMVRIALECEKRKEETSTELMDERMWTMYYNGKKTGYANKREAEEEDLYVMELLKAASMAAGLLPPRKNNQDGGWGGELAYIRTQFEHVVGSKHAHTFYMLSPEGNTGPDLTLFMLRL